VWPIGRAKAYRLMLPPVTPRLVPQQIGLDDGPPGTRCRIL
jgi:hypothetical protein